MLVYQRVQQITTIFNGLVSVGRLEFPPNGRRRRVVARSTQLLLHSRRKRGAHGQGSTLEVGEIRRFVSFIIPYGYLLHSHGIDGP